MDINRLTLGDRIIGVSGIVLFVVSFFKWFTAELRGVEIDSVSGWNNFLTVIAILIGIVMTVYVILKAVGTAIPQANWPLILLILGAVAFLFVLIKVIVGADVEGPLADLYDVKRKIPLFIGLIASAGLAVGAYLNYQAVRAGGGTAMGPGPGPRPGGGPTV